MAYKHTWSITNVFGHPLNNACIYKVITKLISTAADNTVESEHDFYLAPNVLPDSDVEITPTSNSEITWVDSLPEYTPIAELTEDTLWQWIDANEERRRFELINESKSPELAAAKIDLPFVST
jgi:hypothetical protein